MLSLGRGLLDGECVKWKSSDSKTRQFLPFRKRRTISQAPVLEAMAGGGDGGRGGPGGKRPEQQCVHDQQHELVATGALCGQLAIKMLIIVAATFRAPPAAP